MTLILLNHCVQRVDPIEILGDLTVERPIIVPARLQPHPANGGIARTLDANVTEGRRDRCRGGRSFR